MNTIEQTFSPTVVVERSNFDALIAALTKRGYHVVGPTIHEGNIVYNSIKESSSLPIGWSEEQTAGKYHLIEHTDKTLFGFSSTSQSWKKFLHPPFTQLWKSKRSNARLTITTEQIQSRRFAFLGVRGCDLKAIAVLDKVFIDSPYTDKGYQARRSNTFIIAVNCSQAGGTCFCTSMGTGPKVSNGFDLVLTEVLEKDRHYFVMEAGTKLGLEILKDVPHAAAKVNEIEAASKLISKTASSLKQQVDTNDIKELLYINAENDRWHETAKRCLTCGNCTMVCPTCFCTTIEDITDLTGSEASRLRKWDSCFTMEFSYMHGGSIRHSTYSRYRQWLTHKFAAWQDQFNTSGCVGCGRCITWCPVGIDITEELHAIRTTSKQYPSTNTKENK